MKPQSSAYLMAEIGKLCFKPRLARLMAFNEEHGLMVATRRSARTKTIHLKRGEVIRLGKNSGVRSIRAKSGVIWLTATPADGDVLLQSGESFELWSHWPYILEALEEAEVYYFI